MSSPWENRYAQRTQRMKGSAIRELLKVTSQPGVISFGGGLPAPDVFPIEKFKDACNSILDDPEKAKKALQYSTTEGYIPLREMIARLTNRYGINISVDNILITSGSQQALDLIGKVFINPGDHILVESPTYLGALQAWNGWGAEYITVNADKDGMCTDELEEALRRGPKFMYVLPNFQNPTGVTISIERREQIVKIAEQYGVPICEDDPYGQLRYEGDNIPSIGVIDDIYRKKKGHIVSGNVIYLSTFSKTLAPGLRLAWIIAPVNVIKVLSQAKQGMELHSATFNQYIAYEVAKDGFIDNHIEFIRKVYRERRDVMLDALEEHMPAGVKWTRPAGGLFLWVSLPEGIKSQDVFKKAVEEEKVAFVPGESFHPNGGGENTMRLNFSCENPETINEGISRLGRVVKKILG
ncbi:MAG: PLP-dependent aminotransferase family protein [Anaerolineaceae bacterium]|nr:PLP-dependent aminotransferase family protein [Anaerolineaceae bacterium]